jgi:hypothetical protein
MTRAYTRMLEGVLAATAIALLPGCAASTGQHQPTPLAAWNFDQAAAGQIPAGWVAQETHPGPKLGVWKVTADPAAPSKPNVLTLTTAEPDATFNLLLADQSAYKDLDLRVRVRANTGKEDQGGGLVWRCKNDNNYYVCRINPLEPNYRVYKVVNGRRQQLQSTKVEPKTGQWYEVRATMVGDQITCYLDGKKCLEVRDDTFKDAGMIGLWTKADASSSFDDLTVAVPPPLLQRNATRPAEK